MIEKTIFQVIEKALKQEKLLKSLPLKTYAESADSTPYLLYDVHGGTEKSLDFSLHIVSAYKGLEELLTLKQSLVETLEKQGVDISFKFKEAHLTSNSKSNTQTLELRFAGRDFK
jgi:hypothetical protein